FSTTSDAQERVRAGPEATVIVKRGPKGGQMSDLLTSTRREFVKAAGSDAVAATLFPPDARAQPRHTRRYAIVGTGDRGSGMWGRDLVQRYPDLLEFVGLCDLNPKRTL